MRPDWEKMTKKDAQSTADWRSLWAALDQDDDAQAAATVRERLQNRARQYAALPPEPPDERIHTFTALVFRLGVEHYALDAVLVSSARTVEQITPVPAIPAFYRGVVNVRGQIITVIDLRLFFGMDVDLRDTPGELIVVRANELEIGVLAHHISGVTAIPETALEPLEDVRYARGMTRDRVILLDIARLFEDDRMVIGGADD